jgi:hypothetical protein
MLAASESSNAATFGGSIPPSSTNPTNVQRGVSTFAAAKVNSKPSKSTWHDATYEEWTQRGWQWIYSIPLGVSPWKDTTGVQCGINQSGPVWFIGGPIGSTFRVSCTIPKGKAILAPIIDFNNDYPCPVPKKKPHDYVPFEPATDQTLEDYLTMTVTSAIDGVTIHKAELDGKPLHDLRVPAGLFSFTGAASLAPEIDPCVTGSPQVGVSDGYFVFIEPQSVGHHILHIHSELPSWGLSSDGTYDLNITE